MSHSRVIQLELHKRSEFEDNNIEVLTEDILDKENFPDPNWVDYWCDSEDEPENDFKWFVGQLPEGMFEVNNEEMSLTYVQKPTEYIQKFVDAIKAEADKLSVEGFFNDKFSTWNLEKILRNNDNDFMVYEDETDYPIYCNDWIMSVARHGEIGTKFYMGGVLDYHF